MDWIDLIPKAKRSQWDSIDPIRDQANHRKKRNSLKVCFSCRMIVCKLAKQNRKKIVKWIASNNIINSINNIIINVIENCSKVKVGIQKFTLTERLLAFNGGFNNDYNESNIYQNFEKNSVKRKRNQIWESIIMIVLLIMMTVIIFY